MRLEIINNNEAFVKYYITDFSIEYNIPTEFRPFRYNDLLIDFEKEYGLFTCNINYKNGKITEILSNELFQLNNNSLYPNIDFSTCKFYKEIEYYSKNNESKDIFSLLNNNEVHKVNFAYIYVKKTTNSIFSSQYTDKNIFKYDKTLIKNNGSYKFDKYQIYLIKFFSILNLSNIKIKNYELSYNKPLLNENIQSISNIKFNNRCQLLKIICYFKTSQNIQAVELIHNFDNDKWELQNKDIKKYDFLISIKIYYSYVTPEFNQRFNFVLGSKNNSNMRTLSSNEFSYYFSNNYEDYGLIIYDDYLKYNNNEISSFKTIFNNNLIDKFKNFKKDYNPIVFSNTYSVKLSNILNLIKTKYVISINKSYLNNLSLSFSQKITNLTNESNNLIDNRKKYYNNTYISKLDFNTINTNISNTLINYKNLVTEIELKLY